MKEFFDQLREEAERRELPQPAEVRARGDRRAARRGAAGAFSLAVVIAGGFIAAKPLFPEPSFTADGVISVSPATTVPQPIAVPNVVGMNSSDATTLLQQQGFKVQVKTASPPPSGSPQGGKVRQQDPVAAKRIPGETVTIWIDQAEQPARVCADKYPKQLPAALFARTDNEICYADADPQASLESMPLPCPAKEFASDALLEDRRGFTGIFEDIIEKVHFRSVFDQTISKYGGTGAKDYLIELAADIARCHSALYTSYQLTYTVVPQQKELGDQSLLIDVERRYLEKPDSGRQTANFLVSVVRWGFYVIVVYAKDGDESGASSMPLDIARDLLARLTASPSPAR